MQVRQMSLALLTLAVLAALVGTWALQEEWGPQSAGPGLEPELAHGLRFVEGDRRTYSLLQDIEARVRTGPGSELPVVQRLRGELHLWVGEVGDEFVQLGLQLSAATLDNGPGSPAQRSNTLEAPYIVLLSFDGRVEELRFSGETTAPERDLLEEVARSLQVVVPASAGASWQAEEEHATGRYRAAYERRGAQLSKRKSIYIPATDGRIASTFDSVTVLRSEASIELARHASWIERLELEEEVLAITPDGTELQASTRIALEPIPNPEISTVRLYALSSEDLRRMVIAPEPLRTAPQVEPLVLIARGPEQDRELLALVDALEQLGRSDADLARALRRLLASCPDLAERLPGLLIEHEFCASTSAILIHALERAGHPQAQAALRDIAENNVQDHGDRTRAIISLGSTDSADPESVFALWRTAAQPVDPVPDAAARDLATTAALALGQVAGKLRPEDGAAYEVMRANLVQAVHGALSATERRAFLKALSNTGDATLAPEITIYLDDQAAGTRSAAAYALGTMEGEPARSALTGRLGVEQSPRVRARIAASLARHTTATTDSLDAADRALRRETDERARLELARYLTEHLEQRPQSEAVLRELLAKETSTRLRVYLAEALFQAAQH